MNPGGQILVAERGVLLQDIEQAQVGGVERDT